MDKNTYVELIKYLKEEVKININAINMLQEQYKTASNEDKDIIMEQYQFLLGKYGAFNDVTVWLFNHANF